MKVTAAYHDQTYTLDNGTQVSTLLSTDSGVAFIVKTSEGAIYHAGDLNDWHWEGETEADNRHMSSMYRAEIDKIKDAHFDAAFVPLTHGRRSIMPTVCFIFWSVSTAMPFFLCIIGTSRA